MVAQAVAVGQIEYLSVYFGGYRLGVEGDAALLLEVIVGPDVVVAGEEVHLDAHVRQLGKLAEEARVALWHNVFVLVPEVEHVAEQVHGGGFRLYVVEETHQAAFLRACVVDGQRAQMGV